MPSGGFCFPRALCIRRQRWLGDEEGEDGGGLRGREGLVERLRRSDGLAESAGEGCDVDRSLLHVVLAVVDRLREGGQVVAAVAGDPSCLAAKTSDLRRVASLHGEDRLRGVERGLVAREHGE